MSTPSVAETSSAAPPDVAVVLTGGGARAAYQAGVLHALGRHLPELRFPIIVGVSAGGINAAFLASAQEPLGEAAHELGKIWTSIELRDVFRVDPPHLARNVLGWGAKLLLGGSRLQPKVRGLFDTSPLRRMLAQHYRATHGELTGIACNLRQGRLKAIALVTVNYGTGQTVTWIDGHDIEPWRRPERRSRKTRLTVDHVMASAALPLVFPAVQLDGGWYGDGGIRLAAPLAPALHLGADRILAISTRYERSQEEADHPAFRDYPQPAQILGNLMNAVFLDVVDRDIRRLERLNGLLRELPEEHRMGLRPIDIICLRPSQDLGRLAAQYEPELPRSLKFLTRGLGTRETESPDFLSLLMFDSDYTRRLYEIGEQDGSARIDEIKALLGMKGRP